jgi:hypothetical protein
MHFLGVSEATARESINVDSTSISIEDRVEYALRYREKVPAFLEAGVQVASKNMSCSLIHLNTLITLLDEAEIYYEALRLAKEARSSSYFYVEFMVRMWGAYREFDAILECSGEGLRKYSDFSI